MTYGLGIACAALLILLLTALYLLWRSGRTSRARAADISTLTQTVAAIRAQLTRVTTGFATTGRWYDAVRAQVAHLTPHSRVIAINVGDFLLTTDPHALLVKRVLLSEAPARIAALIPYAMVSLGHATDLLVFVRDHQTPTEDLRQQLRACLLAPYEMPYGDPVRPAVSLGIAGVTNAPNVAAWIDAAERKCAMDRQRDDEDTAATDPVTVAS